MGQYHTAHARRNQMRNSTRLVQSVRAQWVFVFAFARRRLLYPLSRTRSFQVLGTLRWLQNSLAQYRTSRRVCSSIR
eukprot:2038483-Rhodomonas_salina.9